MKVKIISGKKQSVVEIGEKKLLSLILKENGFVLPMPCAGKHTCGKCFVLAKGCLSDMSDEERNILGDKAKNFRLSCMTYAIDDCEIVLPEDKKTSILSSGILPEFSLNSLGENYGFAVDVGTTTVALYLYDLKSGDLLGQDVFLNPQSSYGADVISRIESALKGNDRELSSVIKKALLESFKKMCDEYGIDYSLIDLIVLTGNTTMLYLIINENVSPLSKAPFEISNYLGEFYKSESLLFKDFNAKVYIPRTMSAFVGSDITCSVLTGVAMVDEKDTALIVDIGTNGEMALVNGDKLICCSTAAGPAFEGAGIEMGSVASNGAINKVYIEDKKIKYTTINCKKPVGVCGSGLIDAIAAFLKLGLIDETGLIVESNEEFSKYITEYKGSPALKIGDSDILITDKDIRAFQLAKSAICAGIYSLADAANISLLSIDKLLIAGGFGSFIDVKNAGEVGLIPKEIANKAFSLGNASGMGASMILLSNNELKKSSSLAKKAQVLELSSSAYFMDKYIECMMF